MKLDKRILLLVAVALGLILVVGLVVWLRQRAALPNEDASLSIPTVLSSVSSTESSPTADPEQKKKIAAEIERVKQFPPDKALPVFAPETKDPAPQPPPKVIEPTSSEPAAVIAVDKDSDNDGLTDSDEINKYHTNPNKVDTDGDTYPDGQEVKMGYNPLGGGKCVRPDCSL